MPGEVLTDNGKQFTDRFGKGGEVLFDRICRDNGIVRRLTQPQSPATTGKIERFHGSLRRELLDDAVPFADLAAAQAAVDAWVREYNTTRPHQAIAMAVPADRFSTSRAGLSGSCCRCGCPRSWPWPRLRLGPLTRRQQSRRPGRTVPRWPARPYRGGPAEFARPSRPAGTWRSWAAVLARPERSGMTVTFWAGTEVIHLTIARARIKSVRSHLSAADLAELAASGGRLRATAPAPPPSPGLRSRSDRIVSKDGAVTCAASTWRPRKSSAAARSASASRRRP